MNELPDYWQVALAEEDEAAQDAEMAREVAGSMCVAALVSILAVLTAGVLCAALFYGVLRFWMA